MLYVHLYTKTDTHIQYTQTHTHTNKQCVVLGGGSIYLCHHVHPHETDRPTAEPTACSFFRMCAQQQQRALQAQLYGKYNGVIFFVRVFCCCCCCCFLSSFVTQLCTYGTDGGRLEQQQKRRVEVSCKSEKKKTNEQTKKTLCVHCMQAACISLFHASIQLGTIGFELGKYVSFALKNI